MKKQVLLAILLMSALILVFGVRADCCFSPGVPSEMICEDISLDDCCPRPVESYLEYYAAPSGPKTFEDCQNKFFSSNDCGLVSDCGEQGCCCYAELGGRYTGAEVMSRVKCDSFQGDFLGQVGDCAYECGALAPEIPVCEDPTPNIQRIINVRGEKAVRLGWLDLCQAQSFTISRCMGSGCQNFMEVVTLAHATEYDDLSPGLRWNTVYNYKVTAYYETGHASDTAQIVTGDMECWGHYDDTPFCIVQETYEMEPYHSYLVNFEGFPDNANSFKQEVKTSFGSNFNKHFHCNAGNNLVSDSDAPCPGGTVCAVHKGDLMCVVETICRTSGMPFSLFNTKQECESGNYCFYDHSHTNVDDCYDCLPFMSCYDYKSQDACETDNCGAGNCEWHHVNEELGTGVCVDLTKDNCKWCEVPGTTGMQNLKAYNYVFDACTQERMNALSTQLHKCDFVPKGPSAAISFESRSSFVDGKETVGMRLPIIIAEFSKPATLSSYDLKDFQGKGIGLELVHRSLNQLLFKFKPTQKLADTDYVFSIEAESLQGVAKTSVKYFTVELKALKINIKQPMAGHTTQSVVDVIIETDREAECKWQRTGTVEYQNMYDFTSSQDTTHVLEGFETSVEGTDLYVKCSDTELNQIVTEHFIIVLDETPPSISAKAYPSVIAENIDGKFQTTIITKSLDTERVVCKYDTDTTIYDEMSFRFPGFNEGDEEAYKTVHRQDLSGFADKASYTYYVACKDFAGLVSETSKVDFKVDSDALGYISIVSPEPGLVTSNNIVVFEINTNRKSKCSYGPGPEAKQSSGSFGEQGYWHKSVGLYLDEGEHEYHFKCDYSIEQEIIEIMKSTTFVIDTTPPNVPVVDDTPPLKGLFEYSIYLDKLYASWSSEDNLSGIKGYKYTVLEFENNTVVATGYTSKEYEWMGNLELVDGQKYYFSVKAQNNAGLWSNNGSSDGVTIDTSKQPLNETPDCDDGVKNQNETDIDCGGPCPGCSQGKDCQEDDDCEPGLECEHGVCSEADDCSNNKLNSGETDIDCGGVCAFKGKLCGIGQACEYNVECESGSCVDGTCAETLGPECTTEQIASCSIGDCDGTKTCMDNGMWGPCQKTDPKCGIRAQGMPQILKLLIWLLVIIALAAGGYFGLRYYQKKKKPKALPKKMVPRPLFRRPPRAGARISQEERKKELEEEKKKRIEALREKLREKRRGIKQAEREEFFKPFEMPKALEKKEEKPAPKKKEKKPAKKKRSVEKKPKKTKQEDVFKRLRKETKKLKQVAKKPAKNKALYINSISLLWGK